MLKSIEENTVFRILKNHQPVPLFYTHWISFNYGAGKTCTTPITENVEEVAKKRLKNKMAKVFRVEPIKKSQYIPYKEPKFLKTK